MREHRLGHKPACKPERTVAGKPEPACKPERTAVGKPELACKPERTAAGKPACRPELGDKAGGTDRSNPLRIVP